MSLSAQAVNELLARCHLLGSDKRYTNYAGGNASAKATAVDPVTGDDTRVLWVKGSGGDLGTITESGLSEVSPEALLEKGLVGKGALVKVLGRGELSGAVTVKAHAFSKSAEEAITAAGGTVEKLPLPFKVRPAAQGNALTNR